MTLEISTSKRQDSLESIDLKFLQELLQTHPQYNQQKWDTKTAADFLSKPKDPIPQRKTERRRCLERLIGRLVLRDIPGKDLIEEYLRDQYRRNYSVNTMRNAFCVRWSPTAYQGQSIRHQSATVVSYGLEVFLSAIGILYFPLVGNDDHKFSVPSKTCGVQIESLIERIKWLDELLESKQKGLTPTCCGSGFIGLSPIVHPSSPCFE